MTSRKFILPTLCTILLLLSKLAIAEPLYVGGFNVNSANTKATVIAKQMAEHKNITIWGISETTHSWSAKIIKTLNESVENNDSNFHVIKGTTGTDKTYLQIYYDANLYHLISHLELDEINKNKRVRAPLVAKFQNINTKQVFLFMVNHLYRKDEHARLEQAKQINKWIQKQSLPVIAVGDYNFDLSPENIDEHDPGFDAITKNGVLRWIMPTYLLPSQCSRYKSILDFVFISNKVDLQDAYSELSYPELDYCTTDGNSDHRPLTAMIDVA